jgi:hypothetical protein
MFECLLLVHHAGGKWVPILAIPGVIAGSVASIWLMLSGIRGLIAQTHPKDNVGATVSPGRIVTWIGTRPYPRHPTLSQ